MLHDFLKKKPTERICIDAGRVINSFREGIHRSVMPCGGAEFYGVRPHDPSDSLAQIDWITSACLSDDDFSLVSKAFCPDREISVMCAVEDCLSMRAPIRKMEHAAALAWLFALSAFQRNDRFQFISFSSDCVRATIFARNEETLCASPVKSSRINLFPHLSELNLTDTLLVVISDFTPHWSEYCKQLRCINLQKQNIRCLFIALNEWTGFVPVSHIVTFQNPDSARLKPFNLRSGGEAEREAKAQEERFADIKKKMRPLGVSFISIPLIEENPAQLVGKELLKQGFK